MSAPTPIRLGCFVVGCTGPIEFTLTSPEAPPCFVSDACNAHVGEMLGNVAKVLTGGGRAGVEKTATLHVARKAL